MAWGAVFFDYDNDGDPDLYVCSINGTNRLYRNDWPLPCTDVAQEMHVADASVSWYAVAAADIDNDGDLDLAVASTGHAVRLFINHERERRPWAKFKVRGRTTDTLGIGARIDVRTGDNWRTREIIAGSAYKSQDDLTAHFGLNDAALIDEARITWRNGVTKTQTNLPVNATYTIDEPTCPADYDHSGAVDSNDFFAFLIDFFGASADFNADGICNSQDFFDFLAAFFAGCP